MQLLLAKSFVHDYHDYFNNPITILNATNRDWNDQSHPDNLLYRSNLIDFFFIIICKFMQTVW